VQVVWWDPQQPMVRRYSRSESCCSSHPHRRQPRSNRCLLKPEYMNPKWPGPLPSSVWVAPKAVKVIPSGLTSKITVPVGVTPAPLVIVAVSVILPPVVIVVAESRVAVTESAFPTTGVITGVTAANTISGSAEFPLWEPL